MLTLGLRNICVSINPFSDPYFMRFRASLSIWSDGCRAAGRALFLFGGAAVLPLTVSAQTTPATPSPVSTVSAVALVASTSWASLTKPQQTALAPLAKSWGALSEGQRRKWLAIAKNYPDLGPPEQEKLHSRMVEWAALSPKDREQARLNFAQSKAIGKSDRAANWEAYQALSPDERQKLAAGAKAKSTGAAVAVKPVSPDKLAAVPVTRHTPEPERAAAVSQRPLNRSTLLPQSPTGAAASTQPAKP
jgi:hypothetical protein